MPESTAPARKLPSTARLSYAENKPGKALICLQAQLFSKSRSRNLNAIIGDPHNGGTLGKRKIETDQGAMTQFQRCEFRIAELQFGVETGVYLLKIQGKVLPVFVQFEAFINDAKGAADLYG